MHNYNIYVISAPSGTGKTSLIAALRKAIPDLYLSISHTTRKMRLGEQNGKDYFFVTHEIFTSMVAENKFLEHVNVFGEFYGTTYETITNATKKQEVILEIDWQGAQKIRNIFKNIISIFILPPSYKTLHERLVNRNLDDKFTIEKRFAAAKEDISHYLEYDYLVVNDDFNNTVDNLASIVKASRLRREQQKYNLNILISQLTSIDK